MRILISTIFLTLATTLSTPVFAQTSNFLVYFDIKLKGAGAGGAMMNGSTITMMFLGNKFRVDTDMAMANTSLIGDGKSAIMLMEGMGQRGYQTMPTDQDPDLEQPKVRYTGATKTIAGYATKQVILTNADGTEIELWVAESLQPANSASQFSFEGVKGMPLQMDVEMQGMKVHLTAYEVDTEAPDASLFDMTPPPGFRKMN